MTRYRFTFSFRQFVAGLLFGLILFSLTSCSASPRKMPAIEQGARLSWAVGEGRASSSLEGEKIKAKGSSSSVRGDLFARPDYMPGLEVGARLGGVTRDLQSTVRDDLDNPIGIDSELHEAYLALYLRQIVPVTEGLSIYAEGFAGYGYEWGRILGGNEGDLRIRDEAGAAMFGAGAGVEFNTGLSVGIEWSRRDFDLGPVDLEVQDLAVVIGGVLRF